MFLFGATFVFRDAADIPSAQVDAVELAHGEFLAFVGPSMYAKQLPQDLFQCVAPKGHT